MGYFKDEAMVMRYTKAAKQGDAEAQYNLGMCYGKGKGVKQDYQKAVEWLTKAAEQELAAAQYILGNCYYGGEGVERRTRQAKSGGVVCKSRRTRNCRSAM